MKEIEDKDSINEFIRILRKVELIEYFIKKENLPFEVSAIVMDPEMSSEIEALQNRKIVEMDVPYPLINERGYRGIVLAIKED